MADNAYILRWSLLRFYTITLVQVHFDISDSQGHRKTVTEYSIHCSQ